MYVLVAIKGLTTPWGQVHTFPEHMYLKALIDIQFHAE